MATVVLDMAICLRAIFLVYIFLSFLNIYLYNQIILLVRRKKCQIVHIFGAIVHIFLKF